MATLYVAEYSAIANVLHALGSTRMAGQAPQEPVVAEQTVAIAGSSTQSGAFNASTTFIRVHVDAICSVAIGTNPTATTTNKRLAANQTEYFGVTSGQKIAVITNV